MSGAHAGGAVSAVEHTPADGADAAIDRLAGMYEAGELDLPLPAGGRTWDRWSRLMEWGRADLGLARLAEGHTDAVAILREVGREPVAGALYGVWASGGGARLRLRDGHLSGEVRFCSGAHGLDRALVVADIGRGPELACLLEVDLRDHRVRPVPGTWRVAGMAASDSGDVRFNSLSADHGAILGPPGHYIGRPGFWHGGAGVAAVWLGGALGLLDEVHRWLSRHSADAHGQAHFGALHVAVRQTEALLRVTASTLDEQPGSGHRLAVTTARSSAEQTARAVLDLAPRIVGAAGLCHDEAIQRRMADLAVYVRQHHGERDLAELGRALLTSGGS